MASDVKGSRFVFVKCPFCGGKFQAERDFWSPMHGHVPLTCSHCHKSFQKEEAARVVGL